MNLKYNYKELQFGYDDDFYAGLNVAVDLDGHLMGAEGLYGFVEHDATAVYANVPRPLDGVGDVCGGNGAEEALVFAGASLDGYDALVEGRGDLLRPLGQALFALFGLFHLTPGFLHLGGGGHLGQIAGHKEVADVSPAHVHDVSALPDLLYVLSQYYLHISYPTSYWPAT